MSVEVTSRDSGSVLSREPPVGLLKESHAMPVLTSNASPPTASINEVTSAEEQIGTPVHDNSALHSYHLWLKDKQMRQQQEDKGPQVKHEEEENVDDNFRVEAVLERGPSPPESDNGNSYEWSYEEQFKQVSLQTVYC